MRAQTGRGLGAGRIAILTSSLLAALLLVVARATEAPTTAPKPVQAAESQESPTWDRFLELGGIGGRIRAMHAHGPWLLVGRGQRLEVLDPDRPAQALGRSAPLGAQVEAIEARGNRVHVGTSLPAALITIDLSDPGRPREIGRIDLTSGQERFSRRVVDLAIVGSRLFVAPEFGLLRFDLDRDGLPIRGVESLHRAVSIAISPAGSRLLYGLSGGGLLVFDALDPGPLEPSLVANTSPGETLALASSPDGSWLYRLVERSMGDAFGVWLESYPLGFSGVGSLRRSLLALPGRFGGEARLELAGGRLYAALDAAWTLASFSVEDPAAPVAAGHFQLHDAPSDLAFASGRLFLSTDLGDLAELGLGDRGGVEALAREWPAPRPDLGLAANAERALVATRSGLMTLSPSIDGTLRPLATYEPTTWGQPPSMRVIDLQIRDRVGYLLYAHETALGPGRGGLAMIDLSDPASPRELGFFESPTTARGLALEGDRALIWEVDGLRLVDLSRAASPREIGAYRSPRRLEAVALDGDLAYLGIAGGRLDLLSLAQANRPERIASISPVLASEFGQWIELRTRGAELIAMRNGDPSVIRFSLDDPTRPRPSDALSLSFLNVEDASWIGDRLHLGIGWQEFDGRRSQAFQQLLVVQAAADSDLRVLDRSLSVGPPVAAAGIALAAGRYGELVSLRGLSRGAYLPALARGCGQAFGCPETGRSSRERPEWSHAHDRR